MARVCEICGKGAAMGNKVTHRGKAKYLGGVGTKVTGIARRQFKPNLQRLRVTVGKGTSTTRLVCTQCIRGGTITKVVRRAPFKLSAAESPKSAPQAGPSKPTATPKAGAPKGSTPAKAATPKAASKNK